ncbi:MAG: methyltransferase domain-containing protein [Nitrososphaerota archaeon]
MLEVVEHLKNPEKVLKEIYRILRKGGQAIISTPNVTFFMENHLVVMEPYYWEEMA